MLVILGMNETKHIRMGNAHHTHVRSTTNTTLLNDVRHLIDDVHERDWTRGHPRGRTNHRSCWSQKLVSHSGSATSLVNRRCRLCMIHDPLQRVRQIENKASR